MVSDSRWTNAQTYERSFWQAAADDIARGESAGLGWYEWKAKKCREKIDEAFSATKLRFADTKVLEVGSGPVGICAYLDAKVRIAVDPLCDFYASQPSLAKYRKPGVVYRTERAEYLSFDAASFGLVIIDNVIDHVQGADNVMREIYRVLEDNGVLYLTVNLHTRWGGILHRVVSKAHIDKGHPHTFTLSRVRRFLSGYGFETHLEEWEDYQTCRRNDWRSRSLKAKLKAATGLSEFLYTSVSRKV